MTDIIPAILPDSFEDLTERLGSIAGAARIVQIDLCDGAFNKTTTWPMHPKDREHFLNIVRGEEGLPHWQDFDFEVDLMVHHPERMLSWWIAAGIARAVIHLESLHDFGACRDAAGGSVELGIGIDLDPPWNLINSAITRADYIQVMGIGRLGRQGEPLDERVYDVIPRIKSAFPDVTLQVDGGVTLENCRALLDVGVDRFVVGSSIFSAAEPRAMLLDFQGL